MKALFLDRDGVVNIDHGYVYKIENFKFIDGIFEFIDMFIQKNYKIFIVTNQSGIGRRYYTLKDFNTLTDYMLDEFKKKDIKIDEVYFCPHSPEESCQCRKPSIGMVQKALKKYDIDLQNSFMVGDKSSDIDLAINANIKNSIFIGDSINKSASLNFKSIKEAIGYFKMEDMIKDEFMAHQKALSDTINEIMPNIAKASKLVVDTLKNGNKILICGNGGSAGDAQHISAELTGRYKTTRKALPAIALTTDTSALTAIANDFGYDFVFSRQVEALANSGDLLLAISTSGNSKNVNLAVKSAKDLGCTTIGLSGRGGGEMRGICDENIIIPSNNTPRVQEMHILVGHIICQAVDNAYN